MKRTTISVLILVLLLIPWQPYAGAQDAAQGPAEQIDDLTPPPAQPARKVDNSDEHRIPEAYLVATGGPDRFGYTYTDSDGDACAYGWIEPGPLAAALPFSDSDDGTAAIPIGFPFPFYGQRHTHLTIDSNGVLHLAEASSEWANLPLGAWGLAPRIVPFWDDLVVDSAQYQMVEAASGRMLVITFQARRGGAEPLRFQVLLGEDGRVVFQYHTLTGALSNGSSATVGLQGPATGLGYLFNGHPADNLLHEGLAICFEPPDGIYLSPGIQRGYAQAGREAVYVVTAINQTGADGVFDFATESPWPATVTPQRAAIPDGSTLDLMVEVQVPAGAPGGSAEVAVRMAGAAVDGSALPAVARLDTVRVSGDYGYTGASTTDEAAVFDLQTWTLVDTLSLLPEGDYPYDATMKPDGSEVWIPGASGDGVVVIDTTTNQITQRINVGEYAIGVAFRKDGAYAFVSNRDTEDVTVVDTATYAVVDTIPIPTYYLGAGNLALNPDSGDIYVVDWYDEHLFVLDTDAFTVTQELQLGNSMWQLVVSPLGNRLYITDRGLDVVHVLDTETMSEIATVPVGDDPWGIDITPDGTLIYVTNEDSHNVTAIDATDNSVITTIGLPHGTDSDPRDVDFDVSGTYAYVTSGSVTGNDQVYVLDTATHSVAGSVDVFPASNPNVVAVAPQMGEALGLTADKQATPEPVVLGDPLTYTIAFAYNGLSPATDVLVTDTLPAGVAYLASGGGLTSTYVVTDHQVIWELGDVEPGTADALMLLTQPVDEVLPGGIVTNEAYLDFTSFGNFSATVWASSTVLAPELYIRFPDGSEPPDPLLLCEGQTVTLKAVTNRPGPLVYAWDLGDGTLADTPVVTYSWLYGDYTLILTTTNAYGWVETDTLGVEVGHEPQAAFQSNTPVQFGENAVFTDQTAYDPETWSWTFGDGVGTSDQQNPTYNYSNPGAYTVTLNVGNRCGGDSYADVFEVLCQAPVAGFVSNSPIVLGMNAVFTDQTAYDPEAWSWNFGDGIGTSDEQNPVYTYANPGTYIVTLTATNSCDMDVYSEPFVVLGPGEFHYVYLPVVVKGSH
jgi:uncharacterized repeat protein (TIGR01451 family)